MIGARSLAVLGVLVLFAARAAVAAPMSHCATDGTFQVCVTSAAITPSAARFFNGDLGVDVSVALSITNTTPNPIGLAFAGGAMSFMPENAPAITPASNPHLSGMTLCVSCHDQLSRDSTTFSPGKPLSVQVSFTGQENKGAIDLLATARIATFSATLSVMQAGQQRLIPLPAPEFSFGNGLVKH